jgi:hypothetical protein
MSKEMFADKEQSSPITDGMPEACRTGEILGKPA